MFFRGILERKIKIAMFGESMTDSAGLECGECSEFYFHPVSGTAEND